MTVRSFDTPSSSQIFLNYHDTLLIGGPLLEYGQQILSGVYRVDGNSLIPFRGTGSLSFGEHGIIRCMALDSTGRLIIGGFFDSVDGQPASNIAFFDGTQWQPLGGGVAQPVIGIACSKNHIFAMSEGEASISEWDGASWKKPANQQGEYFSQICIFNGRLFGVHSGWLVSWDGSSWTDHTEHFQNHSDRVFITGIAPLRGMLYVAGAFDSVDDKPSRWLATFDGTSWGVFPGADRIPSNAVGGVVTEQTDGRYVYFDFDADAASAVTSGAILTGNGVRWDGARWSAAPPYSRLDGAVCEYHGKLFGLAEQEGIWWADSVSHGALRRSGQAGLAPYVRGLVRSGERIFATGRFTFVDTSGPATWRLPYRYDALMQFDGTTWHRLYFCDSVGEALNSNIMIDGMIAHDSNIYIFGGFERFRDRRTDGLIRFDGSNWFTYHDPALDTNVVFRNFPSALAVDSSGSVFAAFEAQSQFATLTKWNDTRWDTIPSPFPIHTSDNPIVITGSSEGFYLVSTSYAPAVYYWTGSTWDTILPPGSVLTLRYDSIYQRTDTLEAYIGLARWHNGKLFIAGQFNHVNGVPATGTCFLNGHSVELLGTGVSYDPIHPLATRECSGDWDVAFDKNAIYLAGSFNMVNGENTYGVAAWDGTRWWPMGSGLRNIDRQSYAQDEYSGCGSGIVVTDSGCIVSGFFQRAGGKPAYNLAGCRIDPNFASATVARAAQARGAQIVVWPDPCNASTVLTGSDSVTPTKHIRIFNMAGQDCTSIVSISHTQQSGLSLDVHLLPPGQYSIQTSDGDEHASGKFSVVR
ncbi:MAG: T9SS type A sorting domain-containing protein [Bacteroidetes bacterium]|nr:T9SS type A sorting domain-containing protein [Bacteroidota bacterium]